MIDAQFRFNQCNSLREEDISVFSRYGPVLILRSEELIIYYVKTVRFTVAIINKSLIIPTDDWRPTSFGPNDLDITT
jgi:hypothetical protein